VYQEFLALTYKNSVGTFLDELDARLSGMAAVGLVVGEPEKADIKESLLCEAILAKLPAKFAAAKEILYQKRPLKITVIRECLDGKRREAAAPSTTPAVIKQEAALKAKTQPSKSNAKKDYPRCSAGWHNRETTGHTKSECHMKLATKPKAKAAANSHPDSANAFQECCFLDSGASHHMFSDKSCFADYRDKTTSIELADGSSLASPGEGLVHLQTEDNSTLTLKALYVPDLAGTLISLGRLFERGCDVVRTGCSTFDMVKDGAVVLSAEIVGGCCNV
jgi:hypothetical protein